ncbi:tail fiber domain-containing protein [Xylophilus sp.]|uniref:tail fiber domain-containing protein n=1 Tax=Xylophilus sp. TaxID=2653893 RepID=UPI0013BD6B1A|nr:tail fiber domain-containing protein [Xylophilus sp.]KAF1049322.1 MAG: hypothetical protein GAK38_00778 [Xylophilus sp.]
MTWYRTGTVKVTSGSAAVSGSGTLWNSKAWKGDALMAPDGNLYEVTNIGSDTALTLATPYTGTDAAAASYVLVPTQSISRFLAGQVSDLIALYQSIPESVQGDIDAAKAAATTATQAAAGVTAGVTTATEKAAAAAGSATAAASSASAAEGSATTANTRATNASNSATAAAGSATTAGTKAGEASTSATNAANSATAAAGSASTASTKATEASNSASTASTKAGEASTSATNAANSAAAAANKEPTIAAGTTAQFWQGNKTWQDFGTAARGTALTGLVTTTNAVLATTDSILTGLGKLQAQINARAILSTTTTQTFAGPISMSSSLTVAGQLTLNNGCFAVGYRSRNGTSGTYGGNWMNLEWNGSNTWLWVDATGVGQLQMASDERVKQDIAPLAADREAYLGIKPIVFDYANVGVFKPAGKLSTGFSAQNLTKVFPAAVDGDVTALTPKGDPQPAIVLDRPLIALTVLEVQALIREVEDLRTRVTAIEKT